MSTSDIKVLNRRRGYLKGQITRLAAIVSEEHSEAVLSARLESLEEIQNKFEVLKTDYFGAVQDEQMEETVGHLSEIDEELQHLKVSLKSFLHHYRKVDSSDSNDSINNGLAQTISVKLPEIPLPIFCGKFEDWSCFKSQFKSLIEDNPKLTDSQRLYYLHASLKGEAKQIETADDTYGSLFKALEERYENKRVIVDAHIKGIINHEKFIQESAKDLRKLIDCIKKNLRALKILKFDRNDLSDILLINIILQKLDRETRKQFELTLKNKDVPIFDEFMAFLEKRCQILDSITRNIWIKPKGGFDQGNKARNLFVKSNSNNSTSCILCKNYHSLHKCERFLMLSPQERYEIVRKNRLCMNCLGYHKVMSCQSKFSCFTCKARHHSLLHKTESTSTSNSLPLSNCAPVISRTQISLESNKEPDLEHESQAFTSCFVAEKKKIVLATAIVFVKSANGAYVKGRAILDSGSQCNCMTVDFANAIGLRKDRINVPVSGLSGCHITVKRKTSATISNCNESFSATLDFLLIPKITDVMPSRYMDLSKLEIPSYVTLADPHFFKPGKVDLLIGAEIFFEILKKGKIRTVQPLILQETVFGFIVSGAIEGVPDTQHCGLLSQSENLEDAVRKFWEIETVLDAPSLKNTEELQCEEDFVKTHCRDENGRYIVNLPMRIDGVLGDSMQTAKQRLNSLWNRLEKDPEMARLYSYFMKEYEELGHMQELKEAMTDDIKYVMPHHGVYRADSSTTKLRVVFDASALSSSGLSLNNCVLKGGVVQEDLFSVLLRFRKHKFVLTADIKKMYRQIWVNPDQCNMQCILWKEASKEEVKLFKLLTVTYGTACAPFLATRVLKQLAIDEQFKYPLASAAALSDFYVDDILTGSEDISSVMELQRQLVAMLKCGGMNLHKWCSNERTLLEQVPVSDQEYHFEKSDKNTVKTLGLRWNPREDNFSFTVSPCSDVCTKRSVLASIARLFDPLGLLGPTIVQAKIFLQKLWQLKIEWDQELPVKEKRTWERFLKFLPEIKQVKINRYILTESVKEIELHGFSDASKDAYGAVVYLRCINSSNEVRVNLLCSKSRVAPLKVVTIPRLELCAAELLSKLISKVLTALKIKVDRVHLYTDSTIVLAWIDSSPHLLKVFVSNRISRIQEMTKNFHWLHVKTADNPADLVSRGISPEQLVNHTMWWCGPDFLHQESFLHSNELFSPSDESYVQEFKKVTDVTLNLNLDYQFVDAMFNITNDYSRLIRILSFIFRFAHNLKNPLRRFCGPLSYQELQKSTKFLACCVQEKEFADDVKNLKKGRALTGKIKGLNPYLDKDNILRVGGRLSNCELVEEQKHPIILPARHKLTNMIIVSFHKKYLHIGPQNLLYCVRREFWPLNGRSICRKVVHDCIKCFRAKPLTGEQIMGDLPKERVNVNFPFNCTGVDFCGPFLIKYKGQRKGNYHKIYVCIFICMVTKAVYLDIVCDLTSEAFIATLKRFFARRGRSQKMFSDNASNFLGANVELKRLHNLVNKPDGNLANFLAAECIEWKFLPPRAPNFGGLWEAGVKSFKYHLKRVVGNYKLTYEEFLTIIIQIEGILNSRPLSPLSADIDDLEVLTPGHFLIGRPITAIVEPSLVEVNENRLGLWKKSTKMVQTIWKRWQNSYLNNLQQRNKWMIAKNNIKVGDMVIIKEDNLPSCRWSLGRIVEGFPGKDDKVRVVSVKTQNGIYKRSISKIAVLPLEK